MDHIKESDHPLGQQRQRLRARKVLCILSWLQLEVSNGIVDPGMSGEQVWHVVDHDLLASSPQEPLEFVRGRLHLVLTCNAMP